MSKILSDDRVIRVFVSSTFRDMQEDRNYLVKHIFPQLRKLCESRGVNWSEVDLRWGITDEEAAEGKVLPLCLEEIQRCRPYFIGLLGERYGWVPQPEEIPADLMERQPWLKDLLEHSVTELEITHGVLREEQTHRRAYFYFRDPNYILELPKEKRQNFITEDAGNAEKLTQLKQRIRAARDEEVCELHENYRDPQELGQWILEDFTRLIEDIYPSGEQPGELDREAAGHDAVARRHSNVYVGRSEYFDQLDSYLADGGQPLVVCGESGIGKSALLANWFLDCQSRHPDAFTLIHFIGSTADSADAPRLMQRIMLQLKRSFELSDEVPSMPDQIREAFPQWLADVAGRGRIVMVLDSLNQLDSRDHAADLGWLPAVLPQNIRLIVSTLPGRSLDAVRSRDWQEMNVEPLSVPERSELLEKFLAQYSRRLSPERVNEIASCEQSANPLFLRALLDELRQFGEHERLGEMISHYLAATDPGDLYRRILQRWQKDYGRDLVRGSLSLLWASRRGLSERELLDLLGKDETPLPHANWTPFFLASESVLALCSGLFRFSHDYIREAVQTLFLPTEELRNSRHCELAGYWQKQNVLSPRTLEELPWQLQKAEEWDQLKRLLTERRVFLGLRSDERSRQDLQAYWLALEPNYDPCEAYHQAVEDWEADWGADRKASLEDLLAATAAGDEAAIRRANAVRTAVTGRESHESAFALYSQLGIFHGERAEYSAAEDALNRSLKISKRPYGDDLRQIVVGLSNLASLLESSFRMEEAERLRRSAVATAERFFEGHHLDVIASSLIDLALLLKDINQLDEAEELLRRALAITESFEEGKHVDVAASSLHSLAQLLKDTNRLREAEHLLHRALEITEEFYGTQHPEVTTSLNYLATLLETKNSLAEAERLLRRALTISERFYGTEHPEVVNDLLHLATHLMYTRRVAEAEPLLHRALAIQENVYGAEHPKVASSLGHLASLFEKTNRVAEAEQLLRRALAITENSYGAEHPKVASSLGHLASLFEKTNRVAEAEQLLRRALAITENSYGAEHPKVANSLVCLALMLKRWNSVPEAEQLLRRALAIKQNSYGAEHPEVATVLEGLALMLNQKPNRVAEAEQLLRRVLAIREKSEVPELDVISVELALLQEDAKRVSEREPLLRRELAIAEESHGTDSPEVANKLGLLALLLQRTNRMAEAKPLLRRRLAIVEKCYGPEHPDVADILIDLAQSIPNSKFLAELEPLLRRALAISENSCKAEDPMSAVYVRYLGQLLHRTNRLAEAEPLLRREVAIQEELRGPEHPYVATSLDCLAMLLMDMERLAEAEPMLRRAIAIGERSLGNEHLKVASSLDNLAKLLLNTKRYKEAEPLLRRALAITDKSYGNEHPEVASILNHFSLLLEDAKRFQGAEMMLRRALAITEKSYGNEHPEVATMLYNLAHLLRGTNRLAEAEPLMRRAVEICSLNTTSEHPTTIRFHAEYNQLLTQLELPAEEIEQRLESALAAHSPFPPMRLEIERLLGPSKAIAHVLAELDEQYREEGCSEIHLLKPGEAITPHLERLLLPTPLSLISQGLCELNAGSHARAAALFEVAYELDQQEADATELESVIRMNRGVAIRELGGLELASQELSAVIGEMKRDENQPDPHLGRCLFHLAKCQCELGETSRAIETIELSLQAYANAFLDDPMRPNHIEEAQLLRHDLHAKTAPPQRVEVDAETELASARKRLEAISRLNTHPLNQPAGALLDQMLGPVGSVTEVLKTLDEQCRKEGKPPVYFLPLHEPIAPHLDELLGPTGEEW